MTIFPTTTRWIDYKDHNLNVTIHLDGRNNIHYPELIEATVKLFVYVVGLIKAGKDVVEWPEGKPLTPEDGIAHKHEGTDFYPMVESRVVVWDKVYSLTLHSHDSAQGALDAYWAMEAGCKLLGIEKPSAPPASNNGVPQQQYAAQQATGDLLMATRAPSPKTVSYAPGQKVGFKVDKIEIGLQNNVMVWKLWGPPGKQYPLATIFSDNDGAMKSIGDTLNGLGLALPGKPAVTGQWLYVTVASHAEKDGVKKEYLNAVSLT